METILYLKSDTGIRSGVPLKILLTKSDPNRLPLCCRAGFNKWRGSGSATLIYRLMYMHIASDGHWAFKRTKSANLPSVITGIHSPVASSVYLVYALYNNTLDKCWPTKLPVIIKKNRMQFQIVFVKQKILRCSTGIILMSFSCKILKNLNTVQGYCVHWRKGGALVTETPWFWEK